MPYSRSFIFFDRTKNRWAKIERGLGATFIFVIFLTFHFGPFSVPRFGPNLFNKFGNTPYEIIDALSTKKPETIEVQGSGPIVSLKKENNDLFLKKEDFQENRQVVLSFDDGPDPIFTPQILEILDKENVPAIFFVTGEQLFRHPTIAQKIVKGGYQIGVHTYSHTPEEADLYKKPDRVSFELDFSQKLIQAQTGYKTELFRVPFWGTEDTISLNSLVLTIAALDRGYTVVSSTIDSFDWKEKDKEKIIKNSFNPQKSQIILLHDGGGDRSVTVGALPEIIKQYRQAGFQFVTVNNLQQENQAMMYPASFVERVQAVVAFGLFWLKIYFHTLPIPLFRLSLGIVGASIFVTLILSFIHVGRKFKNGRNNNGLPGGFAPFVSVLVPAYNEQKTIEKTIESLLASDYPNFEVIVIDNNSRDRTAILVERFLNGKIRLVNEKRQGKFAALNRGLKNAEGEILVTIDADTQVIPNTISEIIKPFKDPKIGAVAGNLMVGNVINPLTAFQAVEYIIALNLDRRAYDLLGAVPVVPGALGAWRKEAIKAAGGYKPDTLTEDADLTIRVQRKGYKIVFTGDALAYTEAPQNLSAFLRQRRRWTLGILQVLYKNRDIYFQPKFGVLGMILLPYLGLIQLPMMLAAPVVDLVAIISLFISPGPILTYFFGFMLLNFILAVVAFLFAKDGRIWLLVFLPFARIFYQTVWYYVLYRSVLTALQGPIVPWAKTLHFGSVSLEELKKPAIMPAPQPLSQFEQ